MTIIATIPTATPERHALACSAMLAVDRGVPSEVRPVAGGYIVEADDGQAIYFQSTHRPALFGDN